MTSLKFIFSIWFLNYKNLSFLRSMAD